MSSVLAKVMQADVDGTRVHIPAHDVKQHGDIAFFTIYVEPPHGGEAWSVVRRYKQFGDLATSLGADAEKLPEAPFPRKHYFSTLGARLENRRKRLEDWLQCVVKKGRGEWSESLRAFLEVPQEGGREFANLRTSTHGKSDMPKLTVCSQASMTSDRGSTQSRGDLRLVVFDFDQTLSQHHVFKALAGWDVCEEAESDDPALVPAPWATSEEGQLCRIEELNRDTHHAAGGFACVAFGGKERVEEIRRLLQSLRELDVELIICTKGLVGAARKCLFDLDLLQYFSEVYGNFGDGYGLMDYDQEVCSSGRLGEEGRKLLGNESLAEHDTKVNLIRIMKREKGLRWKQCILVEDDPIEVASAKCVCRTLLVQEARGITGEHRSVLLHLASTHSRETGMLARFSCCYS